MLSRQRRISNPSLLLLFEAIVVAWIGHLMIWCDSITSHLADLSPCSCLWEMRLGSATDLEDQSRTSRWAGTEMGVGPGDKVTLLEDRR